MTESFSLTAQLLRKQAIPLGILILINILLIFPLEDGLSSFHPSQETMRLTLQMGLGLWSLLEGFFIFMLMTWSIPTIRDAKPGILPHPFAEPYFNSFAAETLRMAGKIIGWFVGGVILGFLLAGIGAKVMGAGDSDTGQKTVLLVAIGIGLVPGIYKYCKLIFVPVLSIFSARYRAGEIDALKASEAVSRGRRFGLVLVVFLITSVLSFVTELGPNMNAELHEMPMRVLFMMATLLISAWTYSFIYLLFEEAAATLPKE